MNISHLLVLLFCIAIQSMQGATILIGDSVIENQTFSFLVNKHAQDQQGSSAGLHTVQIGNLSFFAADSSAAGSSKEFALSVIARDQNNLTGIARQKATVLEQEIDDPLYNKGIAFLDLVEGAEGLSGDPVKPVLVSSDDLSTLYLMNRYTGLTTELAIAPQTPDATGATTSGIVSIAAADNYVFSATKPTAGGSNFGDIGSGIAVTMLGFTKTAFFGHIDAPTGTYVPGLNRALPFDISSSFIRIGNNLSSIGQIVDMYWDFITRRLYIALDAVGGVAGSDGARSIVVGYVETVFTIVDNKQVPTARILHLNPIAPNLAFDSAGNKIVGNVAANAEIVAHKVRTMQTSTLLNYLIVQGDVGTASSTTQAVYALPLVQGNNDEALNGTIAQKTAIPTDIFSAENFFVGRAVNPPATVPSDMPLNTDAAVLVGGAALPAGPISDMFIRNDTVFVTVKTANINFSPGVFYSTALFDEHAKIKGWTTWKRAITTINESVIPAIDSVDGAFIDPVRGDFLVQTRNDADTATIIKRTAWGNGDSKISQPLLQTVKQTLYEGVFGYNDFPPTTPGLLDISAQIALGNKKIMLIQSGLIPGGSTDLLPSLAADYENTVSYIHGAITDNFPVANNAKIVSIAGGVLDDSGILTTAEIVSYSSNGYVIVGGTNGVAILSRTDGSGWNTATGLADALSGLTNDMSFKKVGDYTFVRKIINDDNFLYILTDTTFDRIDLTMGNIGLGIINPVALATANALHVSTFLDTVVTEKLALLATSAGLIQSGIGANVQTAATISDALWTPITLAESAGPVHQLYPQTTDGRSQQLGRSVFGGTVYVVSANYGKNRARLHRLSVANVLEEPVTGNTVHIIPDLFIKNQLSYFVDFSQMIQNFATDGALFFFAKDAMQSSAISLKALPAQINAWPKTGFRFLGARSIAVPASFDNGTITSSLIHNCATGSFTITGDFGLQIQE